MESLATTCTASPASIRAAGRVLDKLGAPRVGGMRWRLKRPWVMPSLRPTPRGLELTVRTVVEDRDRLRVEVANLEAKLASARGEFSALRSAVDQACVLMSDASSRLRRPSE